MEAIIAAIATRLRTIQGLRVFDYMSDGIAPPTAIVSLPRQIDFDLTYGRGSDTLTIPVLVLVAKVSDRASTTNLAKYLDLSGPTSIKEVIEADSDIGDFYVPRASNVGAYTFGAIDYLGATFDVQVTTQGG